ncbi:Fic family protein [Aliikangiella sp. IMCC44359]|uniref:Fic family protein n=1 Tax=Aliikangiella sp. IMCC44359 TaxID=3459125 RepID=UPI00403A9676
MKWQPKYTISNKLLLTIREIGESIGEIRAQHLTHTALSKLELNARELSSYASTSIEGNPLPLTDVKRLLKSRKETIRDTEREVLNYNKALQVLYQSVRNNRFKLTVKTLEKVQAQVVDGLMDNPSYCGALRQDPVIIRNPRKVDEIVFIPPDAKDVKQLTQLLMDFINQNIGKIEPVILAGIFHRQNVIIHPFIDGNGRTTRLLTTAILGNAGLDLFEIFSFEDYYNRNITRYFKAVGLEGDYYDLKDNIDFSTWLEYFSEGILDELRRIIKLLPEEPSTKPRIETHHQQILDYILEKGSITQREYGAISDRSLASRKLDFEKLTRLNLIRAKGVGRGTYYILASSK